MNEKDIKKSTQLTENSSQRIVPERRKNIRPRQKIQLHKNENGPVFRHGLISANLKARFPFFIFFGYNFFTRIDCTSRQLQLWCSRYETIRITLTITIYSHNYLKKKKNPPKIIVGCVASTKSHNMMETGETKKIRNGLNKKQKFS